MALVGGLKDQDADGHMSLSMTSLDLQPVGGGGGLVLSLSSAFLPGRMMGLEFPERG